MMRIIGLVWINIKASTFWYGQSMSHLANDCIKYNLTLAEYQSIAQRNGVCL